MMHYRDHGPGGERGYSTLGATRCAGVPDLGQLKEPSEGAALDHPNVPTSAGPVRSQALAPTPYRTYSTASCSSEATKRQHIGHLCWCLEP